MNRLVAIFIAGFIGLMILSSSMFVVTQKQYAILFSLGKAGDQISKPGLYFKLPLVQNVVYLDKRILTLDTPDADRFITAEKKNILVDAFVKWRIVDPKTFYVSFSGNDEGRASNRLAQIVKAALNDEITKRTVREVISGQRGKVMEAIHKKVVLEAKPIGIEIVDVRLKRVDYDEQINPSVYERMKAERVRVANELRSTGSAESEKIRADADLQRTVILAEAFRDAEKLKGEGDAKASQIYAEAFSKNPEFYKFYRSLEAYRATFRTHGDVMVLDSNSEFFKYFRSPGGASAPAKK
jgi:membrane protease subunit HflC